MADVTYAYDVIVVGAGVQGSATAYQLSKRGVRVLLLEQFPLPHSRGSSHGQTRITRKAYPEPFYANMMTYCCDQWQQLQQLSDTTILKKIGYLAIGESGGSFMRHTKQTLEDNKADFTELSPSELRQRYPDFKYDDNWSAVFDPEGGILMADKILMLYQNLFVKNGGILRDGEQILSIKPGDVTSHVISSKGKYAAKSVVLCCGPWTNKILQPLQLQLPLQPIRISVCYWKEREPGRFSAARCPTFYEKDSVVHPIYGLPSDEYPGHVKICLHTGPPIDADTRDDVDASWTVDITKEYVKQHFPGLHPNPSVVESCIYTNTPDKHFILDRHPKWKNIIIGAGFSGHGFKLSPAIGKILADLSLNVPSDYDLTHFTINRFAPPSKL